MSGLRRFSRSLFAFVLALPLSLAAAVLIIVAAALVGGLVLAVGALLAACLPLLLVAGIVFSLWSPGKAAEIAEKVKAAGEEASPSGDGATIH